MNDAQPDPVRGIQTAIDHGWLNPNPDSRTAHQLVELLAHVLAGGRINAEFPSVAVSPGRRVSIDAIQDAFERIDVDTNLQHEGADGRATEVVAANDGVVLGRCLIAMGAPRGSKTDMASLPPVLEMVPSDTRLSFVRIYARHRAVDYEQKATLRIQENRPAFYFQDLADLFATVTGESVTAGEDGITISAAAARELDLDE